MKFSDQLEQRDRAVGILLNTGLSAALWLTVISAIYARLAR